jgi:FkbM family methyltransferase
MIDVGAHHGSVLEPFLLAGWKVDAFEPVRENRDALMRKFGSAPNLRVFEEALSNSSGVKELHLALNKDGTLHEFYHSFEELPEDDFHRKGPARHVKATTLDNLVTEGKLDTHVGLLKIDTEGHDLKVLEAASKLDCSVISVEFWNEGHPLGKSPSPPDQMIELLIERGYRYYIAVAHEPVGDSFYYSSREFSPASWGNIFFFQTNQKELYDECIELCTLIGGREKGLFKMLSQLKEILPSDLTFVDVGAFRGEFTALMLEVYPSARALLFEPTLDNYERLRERFTGNQLVEIFNCALDREEGTKPFFVFEKSENNSLLKTVPENTSFTERPTQVNTLDASLERLGNPWRVDFIKTDTQGCDLRVLEGSKRTIQEYRPIILTEVTFIPQYRGQDQYYELFRFMEKKGYCLGGIYGLHQTDKGLIAFADFLFLPSAIHSRIHTKDSDGEFICTDSDHLIEHNKYLEGTCQEQVHVICELEQAVEERAHVIKDLKNTTEERARVIKDLKNTTEERARVIQELHDTIIKDLKNTAEERLRVIDLINQELETIKRHWAYRLGVRIKHTIDAVKRTLRI